MVFDMKMMIDDTDTVNDYENSRFEGRPIFQLTVHDNKLSKTKLSSEKSPLNMII